MVQLLGAGQTVFASQQTEGMSTQSIKVGNLNDRVTEDDLQHLFSHFGAVCGIQIYGNQRRSGTNKGAFRGTPATGKFLDIRIVYIFKIDNKKVRGITEYYDGATLDR